MAEDVKVVLGVDPSTESNVQGWFSGKEFKVRLTPEGEFAKQLEASLQAAQENASKKAADSVAKNLTSAQEKAAKSWETQQRSQITAWAKEQIKAEEDVQRAKEKADKAWAAQQTKQVQELAKAQEKAAKELAKAQEKAAKDSVKNQVQGLNTKTMSNNIQTWLNQNTNAANEFKQRMLSIKSELDSGLVDGDHAKVLSAEIKEIESAARAAAPSITSLGNALKTALGGTTLGALAKAGVAFVGRELRTAAREMVQSAVEIESALAQLQVVTGASGSQLDQFFEAAASSAKNFGVEVKDMLGSIEVFSRLGLVA